MQATKNPKKKILILASGGGTTFEAIVRFSHTPDCKYEVAGLVTNQKSAFVLERAARLKIPARYIQASKGRPEDFYKQTLQWAEELGVDFIALAGFLLLIRNPLLHVFNNRIVNTHPGLLPKFGGKGMYGDHVHQAVVDARERESGVSIHLVNGRFDEGQILAQEKVQVLEGDSAQTLSERVRAVERVLYPKVLNQLVTGALFP